jgi:hypothetical protein
VSLGKSQVARVVAMGISIDVIMRNRVLVWVHVLSLQVIVTGHRSGLIRSGLIRSGLIRS